MVYIKNQDIKVVAAERVRERWVEKKGLFGLIKWDVLERVESMGKGIYISIPGLGDKDEVYINGYKWSKGK